MPRFIICCSRRPFLCILDQILFCKVKRVCDLHDDYITGGEDA